MAYGKEIISVLNFERALVPYAGHQVDTDTRVLRPENYPWPHKPWPDSLRTLFDIRMRDIFRLIVPSL